jgi:hypothetical protein
MGTFDGGDDACTHGASQAIYNRLTANPGNAFSSPLSTVQQNAVKAIASACGEGVGDAIAAAGGLGSGGGLGGGGTVGPIVHASYWKTVAQSLPSGTPTIVNLDHQRADTDAAVTTGSGWKFTCPVGKSGWYDISAHVIFWPGGATGFLSFIDLYMNGVGVQRGGNLDTHGSSGANARTCFVSATLWLNDGDYVDFRLQQNSGSTLQLSTTAIDSGCYITRRGNTSPWSPIDDSTVGYWKLDEIHAMMGAVANRGPDLLSANNPGVGIGTGPGGKNCRTLVPASTQFFQNTSFVGAMAYPMLGSWTFDVWVKLSASGGGSIFKESGNATNLYGSGGRIELTSTQLSVEWLWGGGAVNVVDANYAGTFTLGTWYCIGVRKTLNTGTGLATVDHFINGVLVNTVAGLHNCDTSNSPQQWTTWIGQDGGNNAGYFAGSLAMARLSKVARTNQEMLDFYNNSPTLG